MNEDVNILLTNVFQWEFKLIAPNVGTIFKIRLDRKGLQTFLTEMQTNTSTVTVIIVNRANSRDFMPLICHIL